MTDMKEDTGELHARIMEGLKTSQNPGATPGSHTVYVSEEQRRDGGRRVDLQVTNAHPNVSDKPQSPPPPPPGARLETDLERMVRMSLGPKYPDGNPKTPFGMKKPPLWYVPMVAVYRIAVAMYHGHNKYGHFNWRVDHVSGSTYIDAALRHIMQWKEGEEIAADSGCHHLAHAAACLCILMDAQHHKTLNDDRHVENTDFDALFEELRPVMERIQKDWGHVNPDVKLRNNRPEPELNFPKERIP